MKAKIHYYDIGDYLSREDKLKTIERFGSIENIPWTIIEPNDHGDWLNKRSEVFKLYTPLEPSKKFSNKEKSFFATYSLGIASARDSWVYNFSEMSVENNMRKTICFYNQQREAYRQYNNKQLSFDDFISYDTTKISWNDSLKGLCKKGTEIRYDISAMTIGLYRPYQKSKFYFNRAFIQRPYQMPKLFPTPQHKNLVICVSGLGGVKKA